MGLDMTIKRAICWPYRVALIWIIGVCPDCWHWLGWGQWNDGSLAGKPVCFHCEYKRP